jgi:hypothetical protein
MSHDDNIAPLTGTIQMGDSIASEKPEAVIEQARSPEPSPAEEETTSDDSPKTEEKAPKPYVSGSKKARESGERQKRLAQTLIESAKTSDSALQSLKAACSSDPSLERYLKNTFPKEYARLIRQQVDDEPLFDAEAAKMQAKLEVFAETEKLRKEDKAEDYASDLGFNVEEAEQLKDLALTLEGQKIGGIELDFDQALKKAAMAVREDKAKAGLINIQGGIPQVRSAEIKKDVELDALAAMGRKLSGRDPEQIKENLKIIQDNYKDGVLTIPVNLK